MKIQLPKISKINLRLPVCLILATILWLYVMTEKNPEIVFLYYEVPVKILNEGSLKNRGLKAMNLRDFTATVSLRGLKSDLISFKDERIEATIDLSGYGEGEMKVPVAVSLKEPKYDLVVEKVEPPMMLVQFDKIISDERPIRIISTGEVKEGSVLGSIEPETKTVKVVGPRSLVDRVAYAEGIVNLEDKDDFSTFYIPLKLKDNDGNIINNVAIEPQEVSGEISIKQRRTLPVAIKFTGDLPQGVIINEIEFSPKEVRVLGNKGDLNISEAPTVPIDLATIVETTSQTVALDLPNNISLENPNEKISVQMSYLEEVQRTQIIDKEDIVIENPPKGMNIIISDESIIMVSLIGEETLIANYNPILYIRFEDREYEEGDIEVSLQVRDVPEGIRAEISPKSLKINLENKDNNAE